MKKQNILRKNHEFQDVIQKRKQIVSKTLVLYHVNNNSCLRVGISISKKFANAVMRNRYRRQVRHILDELNFWKIKKDVVLMVRKPFFKLNHNEQKEEINKSFERLN